MSSPNSIRFLYLGDVMGATGVRLLEEQLARLRNEHAIDVVLAQAENVTNGRGCSLEDFKYLKKIGVDFCTGGNWTTWDKSIYPQLNDPDQPIIRPANYPTGTPGQGYKYLKVGSNKILVISLLGKTVGRDAGLVLDNPLLCIDKIIESNNLTDLAAIIVNFHGDYSSEKVVIGQYLNGKVSAVIGDHWHVPTADARILSQGTLHLTDVGMVGTLDSSLGVKTRNIIDRWRDGVLNKNILEESKPWQLNGIMFDILIGSIKVTNFKQLNLRFD